MVTPVTINVYGYDLIMNALPEVAPTSVVGERLNLALFRSEYIQLKFKNLSACKHGRTWCVTFYFYPLI